MTEQALDRAASTILRLRERLAAAQAGSDTAEPIAVVGMACRFPGADDPDAYWDQLCRGAEAVGPAPEGRSGYPIAGYLADVSHFDAEFFGIGAAEAAAMDPQQRLMLELCWEALEDAGLPPEGGIGVFAGVGHQDYLQSILAEGREISAYIGAGNARSVIANRVSYHFGLSGPSLTVDTACSSSLTAIHLACQSLRLRECGIALAGGVNLILSPLATLVTGRSLPLAPDGRTKTFDASADGMVRGEGAGVVVLRPLRDAVANKDLIYALVLATACNADGASNGLTAPNPTAQQRLLQTALARAELDAADLGFLEMHGTGTPLSRRATTPVCSISTPPRRRDRLP